VYREATSAAAVVDAEAREAHIAVAEVAVQQAVETARAAITAAVAALREEDADDRDGAQPRGPHRHCNVSPSIVRLRGHHHRRGSPPVVQRIIKESGVSTPWPMLTKTNYNDWSLLMKVKL
jgi:hypothetical protein